MTDSETDVCSSQSKKEVRSQLREQMEFYFSDANLTKDRFLKKEIENASDGCLLRFRTFLSIILLTTNDLIRLKDIPLSLFLKFNKIRSLTTDLKLIAKALKHSQVLELNDDQTMLRRRITFVEPSQTKIDKRTIYVVRVIQSFGFPTNPKDN